MKSNGNNTNNLASSIAVDGLITHAPLITPGWRQILRGYFQITKPTIVLLVVMTTVPSLILPADQFPSFTLMLATLLGTYFAAASSSVFNHVFEATRDQQMSRTKERPVAKGFISRLGAIFFGAFLGILSVVILAVYANWLAASIALLSNVFYAVFYTVYLKPRTPQNIVIGGAAGAVGPLIGWAAVTGTLTWPAWVLFAIIFFWTPPHFWALALKYKDDYAQAGLPMYPVVYGEAKTKKAIFYYSLSLLFFVSLLFFYKNVGLTYLIGSLILTGVMVHLSWKLLKTKDNSSAMPLFLYSCFYLFGIFGLLTFERIFYIGFH